MEVAHLGWRHGVGPPAGIAVSVSAPLVVAHGTAAAADRGRSGGAARLCAESRTAAAEAVHTGSTPELSVCL